MLPVLNPARPARCSGCEPASHPDQRDGDVPTPLVGVGRGFVTRLLAAMLLLGATGCGNRTTVRGKVTFQGRPVTYGSVIVLSGDHTARSGVIEADGSYTVEGVHPGAVKIGVISHDPSRGRSTLRGHKPDPPARKGAAPRKTRTGGWFPLPRKFEDPETSGLSATLGPGRVAHDLDLK
jgi:hypothetical protein